MSVNALRRERGHPCPPKRAPARFKVFAFISSLSLMRLLIRACRRSRRARMPALPANGCAIALKTGQNCLLQAGGSDLSLQNCFVATRECVIAGRVAFQQ